MYEINLTADLIIVASLIWMHAFELYTFYYNAARKRATYDQFGEEGLKNGVPAGSAESGAWTQGYTFHGNPEKVFREFFGGDNPFQGKIYMCLQCFRVTVLLKISFFLWKTA